MDSSSSSPAPALTRAMSPPLQALGQALKQFRDGTLAPEALEGAVQQFEEKLHLLELPELPGTNTGQPGVQEALTHHHVLLNEYRLGYGDLMAGLSPPDSDKMDQGFHRMVAADALLGMLFDTIRQRNEDYQRKSEEASTVACPRCGTRNRRGTGACQQCRFMLPSTLNEREESDVVGGPSGDSSAAVRDLRTLMDAWVNKDDAQPLHDKLQTLLKQYQRGVERSQAVMVSDIEEDVRDVVRQSIDALQSLAELMDQAIALVQQGNPGLLEGVFANMETQLHDVEAMRLQFLQLAQRHAPGQQQSQ